MPYTYRFSRERTETRTYFCPRCRTRWGSMAGVDPYANYCCDGTKHRIDTWRRVIMLAYKLSLLADCIDPIQEAQDLLLKQKEASCPR